eukprot:TRINITY_DN8843_c0_g1_i1.p1 TRINITY_DN8843_c0_g1~~TRINITY_DN8843_c0_g1_i1.p1  ORF type:complete len:214 (-),score=20.47 TRINITY_DN8843_c0_g1_i1:396-1037(-)
MGLSISAHHDEGMHHAMQAKRESRGDREREKDSSSRCTRTVLFRISFFITPQAFARCFRTSQSFPTPPYNIVSLLASYMMSRSLNSRLLVLIGAAVCMMAHSVSAQWCSSYAPITQYNLQYQTGNATSCYKLTIPSGTTAWTFKVYPVQDALTTSLSTTPCNAQYDCTTTVSSSSNSVIEDTQTYDGVAVDVMFAVISMKGYAVSVYICISKR